MIHKLKIEGFKSIKEQEFDFRGLTVLTGLNSTGKSSVIQTLLLLSAFNSDNRLIHEYVKKYSNFRDIRNKYENSNEIKMEVTGNDISAHLSINSSNSWNIGLLSESNKLTFEKNIFYISSNRVGPEDIAKYDENNKFGIEGEYVFGFFEQKRNEPIEEALIKDNSSFTLATQLNYWFQYILDFDLNLKTESVTADIVRVTFDCDGLDNLSPFNVGAGNSYLAKILIMGLSCTKGNILIVENPEIHLHPKAQSKLADFFVFLQNASIQVIVETHCEHFINKLRHNVYKKKLESNDIVIYYKPSIQGMFEKISINANGHFVDDEKSEISFPSGFFDSTLSELLEIM